MWSEAFPPVWSLHDFLGRTAFEFFLFLYTLEENLLGLFWNETFAYLLIAFLFQVFINYNGNFIPESLIVDKSEFYT